MARYYESKTLIEFVKKYTPHINGETTMECVERAIREAPTADVVPKREYNAAIIDRNAARLGMIAEHERLKTTRADVAREILDKVGNILDQWIQLYYTISVSTFDSIEKAKALASESVLRALCDYVAELKKKYTEGKT